MKVSQYHPVWLRTERWYLPNGTSRPTFNLLWWVHRTLLGLSVLGSSIIFLVSIASWEEIDSKLCPARINCSMPCQVEADGDVAGIGVRYATYIQSFGTILLLGFSSNEDSKRVVRATFVLTSFGITASAGIFALQGSLSLPHAMVVVSLLTQTILPVQIIEPWDYPLRNTVTAISLLSSIIWFHGPWYYPMAVSAVLSDKKKTKWVHIAESSQNDLQTWRASQDLVIRAWHWYEDEETLRDGLQRLSSRHLQPQRVMLLGTKIKLALRIPRIQRFALATLFASIWTYDTERVVKLNLQRNANDWGYGQISAIILTVPSVAGVVQMFVNARKAEKVEVEDRSQELEDLVAAYNTSLDSHDADSNASGSFAPGNIPATASPLPIKRHTQ